MDGVERYAEVAAARAVDEIGFTEHDYYFRQTAAFWELPYQVQRCRHDLDRYCDAVLEAKRHGLPVKLGLEVDWIGERTEELVDVLAPYPWDYLLVSVHWIGGLAVDQRPGLWGEHPPDRVWALYAAELEAAARSRWFDVLAHPDLVKIFGDRVDWDWQPLIDALDGVALEVSSAGLRKPVGELYPHADLLVACRQAGVPATLGSDAHAPEEVGADFALGVDHLRAAGYERILTYRGRRRDWKSI